MSYGGAVIPMVGAKEEVLSESRGHAMLLNQPTWRRISFWRAIPGDLPVWNEDL